MKVRIYDKLFCGWFLTKSGCCFLLPGFLASVFANFDVSPEMSGIGTEHSSPGSNQQTNPDAHYPDVVTDEPSRKYTGFL